MKCATRVSRGFIPEILFGSGNKSWPRAVWKVNILNVYETKSNVSHIQSRWHRTHFDARDCVAAFERQKAASTGKAFGPGIKEFKKATVNTSTEINMK